MEPEESSIPMNVRMANDLASYVRHLPAAEAHMELAVYMRRYWDSRMRLALFAQIDTDQSGPDPLILAAVALLRGQRTSLPHGL
jgi:hypothetical protein